MGFEPMKRHTVFTGLASQRNQPLYQLSLMDTLGVEPSKPKAPDLQSGKPNREVTSIHINMAGGSRTHTV